MLHYMSRVSRTAEPRPQGERLFQRLGGRGPLLRAAGSLKNSQGRKSGESPWSRDIAKQTIPQRGRRCELGQRLFLFDPCPSYLTAALTQRTRNSFAEPTLNIILIPRLTCA